jgi:hypothetical protein
MSFSNFPNITINIGPEIINAIPLRAYSITDIPFRYVVLYNLKHINRNSGVITDSFIPYYISDGQTNNFRANMLFPFICINERSNPITGCATSDSIPGLLYKYSAIRNLNSEFVTTWINGNIRTNYGPRAEIFFDEMSRNSIDGRIGISSVLQRIENLLDFFISIFSERVVNEYPNETYRPNITVPATPFDFTKNTRGQRESRENLDIYDYYRSQILVFLRDYYRKFVIEYKIITNIYTELAFIPITAAEFNNLPEEFQNVGSSNRNLGRGTLVEEDYHSLDRL